MSPTAAKTPVWDAETARVTLFTLVPTTSADLVQSFWKRLTNGATPEDVASKASAGLTQVSGMHEGHQLFVAGNPGRIDILSMALPQSGELPVSGAVIGPAREVLGRFAESVSKVFVDVPPVHRVAFGAVLLAHPISETKEDGYKALANVLKTVQIEPGSSDFLYQINRPRPAPRELGVETINRLTKWSVNSVAFLPVVPEGMQMPIHLRSFRPRLEVDISTPANHGKEIPSALLPTLLTELVALGCEIADKGDIR